MPPFCQINEGHSIVEVRQIWELPDVLLFHVIRYVAAPTHRTAVLCHQLAPLCKDASQALLQEQRSVALWDAILREDYGVQDQNDVGHKMPRRRACKRLRRTLVHRVRDAHLLIQDNTEIAYYYLAEMAVSSSKDKLSRRKLCQILDEYGPHLRVNRVVSSGGLFLVEVCRARHVKEAVVLSCVKEMVESRGALVDASTCESSQSSQTALCVAAVRGMSTVVKYLLTKGASRDICSSGRFRLHTQPKKTINGNHLTPIQFANAMLEAERSAGALESALVDLKKCIKLLE